jgi:hypothetical protein
MIKQLVNRSGGLLLGAILVSQCVAGESVAAGYVDFGKLVPPGPGKEYVEISLKNNLLGMAARLVALKEPEVGEVLRGLQSVRVNVIGLDDSNRASVEERVTQVRADLDAKGWERVVTARDVKDDVGVYVKLRGQESVEGIVVTVLNVKKEAVLINIVGDIKPEKLALLGERLDIEPLKKVGAEIQKP